MKSIAWAIDSLRVSFPNGLLKILIAVMRSVLLIITMKLLIFKTTEHLFMRIIITSVLISRIFILIGFIMLSNQILGIQQKLNQWDKMFANRIIARLEIFPNFNNVRFIYYNRNCSPLFSVKIK